MVLPRARLEGGLTQPLHKHSDRIPDSYLWQRAPTRLVGGHDSRTQEEPTQYILPYDTMCGCGCGWGYTGVEDAIISHTHMTLSAGTG